MSFLYFLKGSYEILKSDGDKSEGGSKTKKQNLYNITPKVIRMLKNSVSDAADDDGWAFLGDVGSLLQKKMPNFDSRNYGFKKLTPLIESINRFEIQRRENAGKFKFPHRRSDK